MPEKTVLQILAPMYRNTKNTEQHYIFPAISHSQHVISANCMGQRRTAALSRIQNLNKNIQKSQNIFPGGRKRKRDGTRLDGTRLDGTRLDGKENVPVSLCFEI